MIQILAIAYQHDKCNATHGVAVWMQHVEKLVHHGFVFHTGR